MLFIDLLEQNRMIRFKWPIHPEWELFSRHVSCPNRGIIFTPCFLPHQRNYFHAMFMNLGTLPSKHARQIDKTMHQICF